MKHFLEPIKQEKNMKALQCTYFSKIHSGAKDHLDAGSFTVERLVVKKKFQENFPEKIRELSPQKLNVSLTMKMDRETAIFRIILHFSFY